MGTEFEYLQQLPSPKAALNILADAV